MTTTALYARGSELGRAEAIRRGLTEAQSEAFARDFAEVFVSGALAERERIKEILALPEAKGREPEAQVTALHTDLSVDQAREFLEGLPRRSQIGSLPGEFSKYLAGLNPGVGPAPFVSKNHARGEDGHSRDSGAASPPFLL